MSDLLLSAAADAIVGYAIARLDPHERVREWLKLTPAGLAFEKALARTYAAFARAYPDLANDFFDDVFLRTHAAPELARLLTRGQHPDPARLANLWRDTLQPWKQTELEKTLYLRAGAPTPTLVNACGELVRVLDAELRAEPLFRPVYDSRVLEDLREIPAQLDDVSVQIAALAEAARASKPEAVRPVVLPEELVRVLGALPGVAEALRELPRALVQAVQSAHAYHVQVGSISHITNSTVMVAGRDVICHHHFHGDYVGLAEYYSGPKPVLERVRVSEFVGREWLINQIDAFLHDDKRTRGALVVVGEAGVGKTTLMAHLVHTRQYVHLFGEQFRGNAQLEHAQLALAAQLVARYQLAPYHERGTLPQVLRASATFLADLLEQASARRSVGEKIVIVCDALDEAGVQADGNVFGLPATLLPEGVYFILSQRPVEVPLTMEPAPETVDLNAQSGENLGDIEAYLQGIARAPDVRGQLRAQGYAPAEFVETLKAKSDGNWMYLHYVLDEIRRGARAPLDLADLPDGLVEYYARFWSKQRSEHRMDKLWASLYLPVLTTLAAIQQPVSLAQIAGWAGLPTEIGEIRHLLREEWRAFVIERAGEKGATVHGLYHASLRDFVTGAAEGKRRLPGTQTLVDELREGVRESHQRILAHFSQACAGEWPKLVADAYERLYLVAHLAGADRWTDAYRLVAENNAWAEARYRAEESYAGYLVDLEKVWRWAEGLGALGVGRQVRCALIWSSVHSLAGNLGPELVRALVEVGIWSPAGALAHVGLIVNAEKRSEALIAIFNFLPSTLYHEAFKLVYIITDEESRGSVMKRMLERLPASQRVDALSAVLAAASRMADQEPRVGLLITVAELLPAPLLGEVLVSLRFIKDEWNRALALSVIVPHLPRKLLGEAFRVARGISNTKCRTSVLDVLLAHLPEKSLDETIKIISVIEDEKKRAEAIRALATRLPVGLLGDFLKVARAIEDDRYRAYALSSLAERLPKQERESTLSEALFIARMIKSKWVRLFTLVTVAEFLPREGRAIILGEARKITRALVSRRPTATFYNESWNKFSAETRPVVGFPTPPIDLGGRLMSRVDAVMHMPAGLVIKGDGAEDALELTPPIIDEKSDTIARPPG